MGRSAVCEVDNSKEKPRPVLVDDDVHHIKKRRCTYSQWALTAMVHYWVHHCNGLETVGLAELMYVRLERFPHSQKVYIQKEYYNWRDTEKLTMPKAPGAAVLEQFFNPCHQAYGYLTFALNS